MWLIAGALAVVVAVWAASAFAGGGGDLRAQDVVVPAPSLGDPMRAEVVLPADYATSGKRYPVIYFLHGLPAAPFAYRGVGFLERALDGLGPGAILVAPQGARVGEDDAEYHDWGPGRNWETAVARDLPHYIDTHYRTIADRRGRAIVGLSAGGYGAMLVALHHLGDFSVVESWSGYFHPTDTSGLNALDLGSAAANDHASAHRLIASLRADERVRPTFLAFYVGRDDGRFRAENRLLHSELRAASVPHVFHVYPGGHVSSLWQAHAAGWLKLALEHLRLASP